MSLRLPDLLTNTERRIDDDLAVGIPGQDIGAQGSAGQVIVFFGSASGLRTDNEQSWHQNTAGISGAALFGDNFGAALTSGDFDNDGYDDLVIGIPGKDTGVVTAVDAGVVMLLPGSSGGPTSVEDV